MMLKTRADFVRRATAENAAVLKSRARIEKELKRLYRSYTAQIKALVRDPEMFSAVRRERLAFLVQSQETLTQILIEAGRDDVVGAYLDEFAEVYDSARDYFKAFGKVPKLGGNSREALQAYIEFSEGKFITKLESSLVAPMQEALFHGTFGNVGRRGIINTVVDLAENLTPKQAVTLVDDSFRKYQRSVSLVTAEDTGLDIFWYQGPNDEIISEQCQWILENGNHGVPGMWNRDEITIDMIPGITLKADPLVAGGHPNCRHKFYAIPESFAKEKGYKP